jgi:hypothetical protein
MGDGGPFVGYGKTSYEGSDGKKAQSNFEGGQAVRESLAPRNAYAPEEKRKYQYS